MAHEFIAKNGIISQGNLVISGSITTTGAITVSGSIASASYAVSSSNSANSTLLNSTASTVFATTASNSFTGKQYISATDVPNAFTATASIYTDGGLQVTKNAYFSSSMFIKGDLTIYGTQSIAYITSSQLNIATNIITVNTATPSVRFGGLSVYDSGSTGTGMTGSIFWDSQNNRWIYSNPSGSSYDGGMFISGPRNTSGIGSEQGTTACMLMVGQGGDHITSSIIYHDSTVTCITGLNISGSGNIAIGGSPTSASLFLKSTGANGLFLACDGLNSDVSTRILFQNCRNQYAIFNSGGNLQFNYGATLIDTSGTNGFYMSSDGSVTFQSRISGTMGYFANCVGIGTSSPTVQLEVQGVDNGGTSLFAKVYSNNRTVWTGIGYQRIQTNGDLSIVAASDICFLSGGSERMRIMSTGNVGINTTNFGEKLNVGCGGAMAFQNTCNCQKWHIQYNSNDGLNFVESSVADFRLFLKAGGYVGIGTGAPCSTLTSRGTDLTSFTSTSFGNLFLQGGPYDGNKIQTIDFGSTTYNVPLARIAVKVCGNGTHMMLGTSNDYSPGITNCGIYINYVGNVGIATDPGAEKFVIYGGSGLSNVFLRLKTDGTHGTKPSIYFDSGLVGTNRSNKVQLLGGYNSPTGGQGGNFSIYTADSSENLQIRMCIDPAGQVTIQGALAKGSGSFRICHPLSSKVNTHALVHSFIEGPNADLIYSGHTKLIGGVSCINIDCVSRMTEGTFEALNRCVRIFTTNESSWSAVKGKVCGNIVVIESQDNTSEDEISWMVIGERQDSHMFETDWTDNEGRVITEPEIIIVEDNDITA